MKTVVHYIDSNLYGGVEEIVSLLLSGVEAFGWRAVLLHHESPGLSRLLEDARKHGVSCHAVPRFSEANRFVVLRELLRAIRLERPDVFHAHLSWTLGCRYGLMAAKLAGVPRIVVTSHLISPLTEEPRFLRTKAFIQDFLIDRYLAVSKEVAKGLCTVMGIRERKIRVVSNGVRVPRISNTKDSDLRKRLGVDTAALILTAARLHLQKGHRYLLEAAACTPDATFLLAGEGPERSHLEAYRDALNLGARVRFLGDRSDVSELLAACDLVALPSLYEGLPLSVLEAMAAGKPVVATSVGGTDEAVIDGETGLLVPPADSEALALAINHLLAQPEIARRYGETGRERAIRLFSVESMTRAVIAVYDEIDPQKCAVAP